jgi:hypothetical protein
MRIAVVGGCASGKSTVVSELKRLGRDAYIVGQEHSGVASLWAARSPDALVYLHISFDEVKQRRGEHWPEWLYMVQQERLSEARAAADVRIDTAEHTLDQTIHIICDQLPDD